MDATQAKTLRSRATSWPLLVAGAVLTTVLSLTVHVFMLQVLHEPYPASFPRTGWPIFPAYFFITISAIYIDTLIKIRIRTISVWARCVVLFLLIAGLREQLFRAPFMNFINGNPYTIYVWIANIPRLIPLAVLACLVVSVTEWSRRKWQKWLAGLAISVSIFLLCLSVVNGMFAEILRSISSLNSPNRYNPPYNYHIIIPAYLTFLEPVIASFLVGALIWEELPARWRILILTALIFAIKGPVVSPFINIIYAGTDPMTAVLSMAQFSFESITLGLCTAVTLKFSLKSRTTANCASEQESKGQQL
jgi:heme exporter protein D